VAVGFGVGTGASRWQAPTPNNKAAEIQLARMFRINYRAEASLVKLAAC
jgi:hypothetical protein